MLSLNQTAVFRRKVMILKQKKVSKKRFSFFQQLCICCHPQNFMVEAPEKEKIEVIPMNLEKPTGLEMGDFLPMKFQMMGLGGNTLGKLIKMSRNYCISHHATSLTLFQEDVIRPNSPTSKVTVLQMTSQRPRSLHQYSKVMNL